MRNLSIICRHMKIFSERRLSGYNIGFAEQIILMYLSVTDNVNQEQISRYFEIDKGSIAKTLKKLENKNLIIRTENPDNKREKIISITDKAIKIVEEMDVILKEWNSCISKGIEHEDLENYNRITQKMAENAVEIINENKE